VPKAFRQIVHGFVRGQPMVPIATLRTERSVQRLRDGRGDVLAEFADDRVRAETPAAVTGEAQVETWREWEVELVEGDRRLLAKAEKLLTRDGGRVAEWPSKLARALGERMPAPAYQALPVDGRETSARNLVHARLVEQLVEIRRRDPMVRQDMPDAVHKKRVALRRLRTALAVYRPILDREVTDPVRDELRWLGGALGEARDTEVVRDRLVDAVAALEPRLVRGPVRRRLHTELDARYRSALANAVGAMESPRYFALLDLLDALVDAPPWTELADAPAKDVLTGGVRRAWRRLRRSVADVSASADDAERDLRLHEVRKAAKRARYAAEPLVPLFGADAVAFVRATKRVQTVLGDHQDSIVCQTELLWLADQASRAGENAFTFGVLYAREQENAAETSARFDEVWKATRNKKLRRWLS
jgi:CHAD domain-containing protein